MRKLLFSLCLWSALNLSAQDTISKNDLSFTRKEIDTMYTGVRENQLLFRMMHAQTLNNAVPMSLWHNPVLPPGMNFPVKQEPMREAAEAEAAILLAANAYQQSTGWDETHPPKFK